MLHLERNLAVAALVAAAVTFAACSSSEQTRKGDYLAPDLRARVQEILDVELADDELAWELHSDGTWTKVETRHGVNTHRRLEEYALERAGVLPGPHA